MPHWLPAYPSMRSAVATISDQTIEFGALTLNGAGGAKAVDSLGNEVDIIAVSGSTGWSVSGGRISRSSAPNNGAVLSCTTALGTINVTISTIADGYSFASDAELTAILAIATATLEGKTILGRAGSYAFRTITETWGVETVIKGHTGAVPYFAGLRVNSSTNVTLRGLEVQRTDITNNSTAALAIDSSSNVIVDSCEVHGIRYETADYDSGYAGNCRGIAMAGSSNVSIIGTTYIHHVHYGISYATYTGNFTCQGTDENNPIVISNTVGDGINLARVSSFGTDLVQDVHLHAPESLPSDGSEHCDGIQFNGGSLTANWTGVTVRRVYVWEGARGTSQGIFFNAATSGYGWEGLLIEECAAAISLTNAITVSHAKNSTIRGCTAVKSDTSDTTYTASLAITNNISGCVAYDNIYEGTFGDVIPTNSVVLGKAGATIPYGTAFSGSGFNAQFTTFAAMQTRFTRKSGGPADPNIGAFASYTP